MALTPEQFNKLATKEDLEKLASKEDLKELKKETDKKFDAVDKKFDVALNVFASKEDLKELKRDMATKKDINKILTAVDGIAKKHQDFETELAANQGAHDRFEEKFIKTDKRIKVVERKLNISPVAA